MIYEQLMQRRSIRKYQTRPVESEKIENILKSGLLSPSSKSRRPWAFVVVEDPAMLEKMGEARGLHSAFIAGAPLGIVVTVDPEKCDVWIEDASITAILMQLQAHELGLGSCWIQIRERMHSEEQTASEYIQKLLDIPQNHQVLCMLAIGYSDEEKKAYTEAHLKREKIHYKKYRSE